MAVPAHDTRDWEFAKKFGLPIIEVVKGNTESNLDEAAFTDVATGTLVNSGFLDGLSVTDAKKKMIEWLEANGKGCDKVTIGCGAGVQPSVVPLVAAASAAARIRRSASRRY